MIAVAIVLGVVVGGAWWLLRDELAARRLERARRLSIDERRLAIDERRSAEGLGADELPADLRFRCDSETEAWARDQVRNLIHQLHGRFHNWDAVRTELAKIDAAALAAESGWSQTEIVS